MHGDVKMTRMVKERIWEEELRKNVVSADGVDMRCLMNECRVKGW
jgi:hypothetical protein